MSLELLGFRWFPIFPRSIESAGANRIKAKRSPRRSRYSKPVLVILDNGDRLFASSRNISKGGIGLSHEVELPLGNVQINVDVGAGRYMHVRARLVWCRQVADDSYISGAQFLSAPIVCTPLVRLDSQPVRSAVA